MVGAIIHPQVRGYIRSTDELEGQWSTPLKTRERIDLTWYRSGMFIVHRHVVIVRALVVVHWERAAEIR